MKQTPFFGHIREQRVKQGNIRDISLKRVTLNGDVGFHVFTEVTMNEMGGLVIQCKFTEISEKVLFPSLE
jgi:hypothetical protein